MASESALKIATSFMVGQYLKIFQLIAAARNSHAQSRLWGNRNTNHSIMLIVKWIKLESQPPKKTKQTNKQTDEEHRKASKWATMCGEQMLLAISTCVTFISHTCGECSSVLVPSSATQNRKGIPELHFTSESVNELNYKEL